MTTMNRQGPRHIKIPFHMELQAQHFCHHDSENPDYDIQKCSLAAGCFLGKSKVSPCQCMTSNSAGKPSKRGNCKADLVKWTGHQPISLYVLRRTGAPSNCASNWAPRQIPKMDLPACLAAAKKFFFPRLAKDVDHYRRLP